KNWDFGPRRVSARRVQQVGAQARGFFERGLLPPFRDFGVMAAQESFGHFPAAKVGGAGPLRAVENAFREGLVDRRIFVAENAGKQARDGVDDNSRGEL